MLTSDLVRPKIRSGEISVARLSPKARDKAIDLAKLLLETLAANVGRAREEVDDALATLDVPARDLFLFRGLKKLALDGCTFESPAGADPAVLREAVFKAAKDAHAAGKFNRDVVLATVATEFDLDGPALDRALFSDLKSAQILLSTTPLAADALVDAYDRAGPKAILLKATRVVATVRADAPTMRRLFHRLKFMRLLFEAVPVDDGWRLTIDGPMSLFSGQARYGLKLAIALDVLEECDALSLQADVRWGKRKTALKFSHEGGGASPSPVAEREEIVALVEEFASNGAGWTVVREPTILVAPTVGACVTDLSFIHDATGEVIHFELLGYWSRDAVWRRVDLVGAGLNAKVIFAFSEKLRVSERALDKTLPSTLLPFKGTLRAKAVLQALEDLRRPAKKPTAKKPTAKKPTAKKPTAKTQAAKTRTTKTSAVKKTAAKKRTAKTSAAKKTAAKKTAATKTAATKSAGQISKPSPK